MSIKLIAVDMDGTFLSDTKKYDVKRFNDQYQRMKEKGIKFVVASGNQYYQLSSFFPNFANELTYVAENGALVVEKEKKHFVAKISEEDVESVIKLVHNISDINMVICGENSAYVEESVSDEFFKYANQYYHRLKRVDDVFSIEDTIFKFALSTSVEKVNEIHKQLVNSVGEILFPVGSGHGDIDLILPGVNKAHGLKILQEKWDILDSEILAFGDSNNDLEMLNHAHYSYAMENGNEHVKKVAKYIAPSNNESGVLEIIEKYI